MTKRKTTSFSAAVAPSGDVVFTAVANDGTMWFFLPTSNRWEQAQSLPQPAASERREEGTP